MKKLILFSLLLILIISLFGCNLNKQNVNNNNSIKNKTESKEVNNNLKFEAPKNSCKIMKRNYKHKKVSACV